jgi:hypothetical protein
MWNSKNKNIERANELRIVQTTNSLGEIRYTIEKFHVWGKYMSCWFTEKSDIDTLENAVKIKTEKELEILRATIVQRNVL